MNELIQKLCEMDEKASEILSDAKNRSAQLDKKLLLEQDQMDELMQDENEEQLQKLQQQLDLVRQRETVRMEKETEEKKNALRLTYEQQKDSLTQAICQRILGV